MCVSGGWGEAKFPYSARPLSRYLATECSRTPAIHASVCLPPGLVRRCLQGKQVLQGGIGRAPEEEEAVDPAAARQFLEVCMCGWRDLASMHLVWAAAMQELHALPGTLRIAKLAAWGLVVAHEGEGTLQQRWLTALPSHTHTHAPHQTPLQDPDKLLCWQWLQSLPYRPSPTVAPFLSSALQDPGKLLALGTPLLEKLKRHGGGSCGCGCGSSSSSSPVE